MAFPDNIQSTREPTSQPKTNMGCRGLPTQRHAPPRRDGNRRIQRGTQRRHPNCRRRRRDHPALGPARPPRMQHPSAPHAAQSVLLLRFPVGASRRGVGAPAGHDLPRRADDPPGRPAQWRGGQPPRGVVGEGGAVECWVALQYVFRDGGGGAE